MNYSKTGIANMALQRLGARGVLSDVDSDNLPNAIKVRLVWDMVFQEVLSRRDWKFAKIRAELQKLTVTPSYAYANAYLLPADFLRLVKPRQFPSKGVNPVAYPPGYWYYIVDPTGYSRYFNYDPPVFPAGFPYVIETINTTGDTYVKALLTDFDNTANPLYINYIRLITDLTLLSPAFVNCLADRLAGETAIAITEDPRKKADKMQDYEDGINSSEALNESYDSLSDESGSTEWEDAGR